METQECPECRREINLDRDTGAFWGHATKPESPKSGHQSLVKRCAMSNRLPNGELPVSTVEDKEVDV